MTQVELDLCKWPFCDFDIAKLLHNEAHLISVLIFLLRYGVSGVWLAGILRAFTTSRYWNRQSQPTPWDLVWSLQKNKQHTILVIGCLHTYICADASALN